MLLGSIVKSELTVSREQTSSNLVIDWVCSSATIVLAVTRETEKDIKFLCIPLLQMPL